MLDFFASLYEWFGLIPFYAVDLGTHLRGYDTTCTAYIGTPWYTYIGFIMIGSTAFFYALLYHIIDSPRMMRKKHWWIFALIIILVNFLIAFTIPFNSIQAKDFCSQLNLSTADCIGFGISNAIWSFILFIIISSIPVFRRLSTNCRQTTFWKP